MTPFIDDEWFAVAEGVLDFNRMLALLESKIVQVNAVANIIKQKQGDRAADIVMRQADLLEQLMKCKRCLTGKDGICHDVFWSLFAQTTAQLMEIERRVELMLSHIEL